MVYHLALSPSIPLNTSSSECYDKKKKEFRKPFDINWRVVGFHGADSLPFSIAFIIVLLQFYVLLLNLSLFYRN